MGKINKQPRRRNNATQPTSHQSQATSHQVQPISAQFLPVSEQIQPTSGPELRIRSPDLLFPRRIVDLICFAIMFFSLPTMCIWDMTVILPLVHKPYTFFYALTFFAAMFFTFNIKSNFLACLIVDTSVDFKKMQTPLDALEYGWRICKRCKRKAPPRSWHCNVCKTCILRRDHHCTFLGCCIGHNNYRYFFFFLIYLFIGSVLSFGYFSNYLFFIKKEEFLNKETFTNMGCPLLIFIHRSFTWHNLHIILYDINIISVSISGVLLITHLHKLVDNGVCFECRGTHYNLGFRKNCESVFGKRMHLAWISPFIESELPYDGVFWEPSTLYHDYKVKDL